MILDEVNMTIDYLKEMQESYIEGEGYERHPLPGQGNEFAAEFMVGLRKGQTEADVMKEAKEYYKENGYEW